MPFHLCFYSKLAVQLDVSYCCSPFCHISLQNILIWQCSQALLSMDPTGHGCNASCGCSTFCGHHCMISVTTWVNDDTFSWKKVHINLCWSHCISLSQDRDEDNMVFSNSFSILASCSSHSLLNGGTPQSKAGDLSTFLPSAWTQPLPQPQASETLLFCSNKSSSCKYFVYDVINDWLAHSMMFVSVLPTLFSLCYQVMGIELDKYGRL